MQSLAENSFSEGFKRDWSEKRRRKTEMFDQ